MSDLHDLLNKAKGSTTARMKEDSFDDLDDFIQDAATSASTQEFDLGISKDGEQLSVGDPVVGIFRGQNMSGIVIGVNGDMITVEWKNNETSTVKANTLTMSNVDDDYQEETMYIESIEPNMGFDKESFCEDADLDALLHGKADGSSNGLSYNINGDL